MESLYYCDRAGLTEIDASRASIRQTHVHEVVGSVRLAELGADRHNHRFAGVTSVAVPTTDGHIHTLQTKSDFYEDHFHPIVITTGPPVIVGRGADARHIHFIDANTVEVDEHFHPFLAATLIDNPIGHPHRCN